MNDKKADDKEIEENNNQTSAANNIEQHSSSDRSAPRPNDNYYYNKDEEEEDDDDDDREPGELVIKEDPTEDEEIETASNDVMSQSEDGRRTASSTIESIFSSKSNQDQYEAKISEASIRAAYDQMASDRALSTFNSSGVHSTMLSHSQHPSISSLHSVLDSVNSNLTRHQFEQTIAEASASNLLSSSTIASDLRCSLCGTYSVNRLEALHHARKLCPALPQISSAQEGLQEVLISGLASKLQRIASTSSTHHQASLQQNLAHFQQQQLQQHIQQQRNFSSRGSSSYKDEESGSDVDIGCNGQMVVDIEENSRDGRKVRSRSHIRGEHLDILRPLYIQNPRPKKEEIISIANRLGFPARVVQVWFQNARARDRREGRTIPSTSSCSISASLANSLQNSASASYSNSVPMFRSYDLNSIVNNNVSSSFNEKLIVNNRNCSDATNPAMTSVSSPVSSVPVSSALSTLNISASSLYPSLLSEKAYANYRDNSVSHLSSQSLSNISYDCNSNSQSDQDSMPLDLSTKRSISPVSSPKASTTPVISPSHTSVSLLREYSPPHSPIKRESPSITACQDSEPLCLSSSNTVVMQPQTPLYTSFNTLTSPVRSKGVISPPACTSPVTNYSMPTAASTSSISISAIPGDGSSQVTSNGVSLSPFLSSPSTSYSLTKVNGNVMPSSAARAPLSSVSNLQTTASANSDQSSKLAQILQEAKLAMPSLYCSRESFDYSEKRSRVSLLLYFYDYCNISYIECVTYKMFNFVHNSDSSVI